MYISNMSINSTNVASITSINQIDEIIQTLVQYRNHLKDEKTMSDDCKMADNITKDYLAHMAGDMKGYSDVYLFIPEAQWDARNNSEVDGLSGKLLPIHGDYYKGAQVDEEGDIILRMDEEV